MTTFDACCGVIRLVLKSCSIATLLGVLAYTSSACEDQTVLGELGLRQERTERASEGTASSSSTSDDQTSTHGHFTPTLATASWKRWGRIGNGDDPTSHTNISGKVLTGGDLAVDSNGHVYAVKDRQVYRSDHPGLGCSTMIPVANGDFPTNAPTADWVFRLLRTNGRGSIIAGAVAYPKVPPLGYYNGGTPLSLSQAWFYYDRATNAWIQAPVTYPDATYGGVKQIPQSQWVNTINLDREGRVLLGALYDGFARYSEDGGKTFKAVNWRQGLRSFFLGKGFFPAAVGGSYSFGQNPLNNSYFIFGEMTYFAFDPSNPSRMLSGKDAIICPTIEAFETGAGCDYESLRGDQRSATYGNYKGRFIWGIQRYGIGHTRLGEALISTASKEIVRFDRDNVMYPAEGLVDTPKVNGFLGLEGLTHTFLSSISTYTITRLILSNYGYNFFVSGDGVFATTGLPKMHKNHFGTHQNLLWFPMMQGLEGIDFPHFDHAANAIDTDGNTIYLLTRNGDIYFMERPAPPGVEWPRIDATSHQGTIPAGGIGMAGGLSFDLSAPSSAGKLFAGYDVVDGRFSLALETQGRFSAPTFSTGHAMQLWTLSFGGCFSGQAQLTFAYDSALLDDADETALSMYHYNGTSWDPVPSVVDTVSHSISITTSELGMFALGY